MEISIDHEMIWEGRFVISKEELYELVITHPDKEYIVEEAADNYNCNLKEGIKKAKDDVSSAHEELRSFKREYYELEKENERLRHGLIALAKVVNKSEAE